MQYTNPEIPEGINTSSESHFKDFLILTVGVITAVVAVIYLLIFIVDLFADKIPFEYEKKLPVDSFFTDKNKTPLPDYLQNLSAQIINDSNLDEEFEITVHYINNDTVNAFATLGGHIVLYRGLLEKLQYEDELAMLIAHEVAHVKYRHPILSVSHGVVMTTVIGLLNMSSGSSLASDLLGQTSMLSLMQYSRDYEYQSDEAAVNVLLNRYQTAAGAVSLFSVFKAEQGKSEPYEFFSTHPLTDKRIDKVNLLASGDADNLQFLSKQTPDEIKQTLSAKMKPLPESFKQWLVAEKLLAEQQQKKQQQQPSKSQPETQ